MQLLSHPIGASYRILEKYTAGIKLAGYEVKSLKMHRGSLRGAFVRVGINGAWIEKMNIPPYQPANTPGSYHPLRSRKLLLSRSELRDLTMRSSEKGLTILPIELYNDDGIIRVTIALVKKNNTHDKREIIKKKQAERDNARSLRT